MRWDSKMKVINTLSQGIILVIVQILSDHSTFKRIVAEIERNNITMAHSTGTEKRAVVLADLKVIFNDLAVPVGKRSLSILIDLAVGYLEAQITNKPN